MKSIGNNAFEGCTGLTEIIIPDSVISIGSSAFENCTFEKVTVPAHLVSLIKDCTEITVTGTNISASYFSGCSNFTNIIVSDTVTSISKGAFKDCVNLKTLTLPFIGESRTSQKSHFSWIFGATDYDDNYDTAYVPSSLKEVIVTSATTIDDDAFYYCNDLGKISISNSVTSIGDYVFTDCASLKNIEVAADNGYYQSIDGNLYTKGGTTLLQYAKGKTETSFSLPSSVETVGKYAFAACEQLTSITLSSALQTIESNAFGRCGITEIDLNNVKTIGRFAFAGCNNLSTITIPESVTMVEDYAFNYCSNLMGAVIKGGAKTIGSSVFESCSLLEEIEIGVGITKIGANLINDCDNIERITYKGTTTQWSNISRVKTFNTEHVYQTVTCSDGSAYLYA